MEDLYRILRVEKNATQQQIRKAFRKLSKKFHPDVNDGDDTEFKKINNAYHILVDEEKRKQYDETGTVEKDPEEMFYKTLGAYIHSEFIPFMIKHDPLSVDVLKIFKKHASTQIEQLETNRKEFNRTVKRLKIYKSKFTRKKKQEIPIIEGVIESTIIKLEKDIRFMTQQIIFFKKAFDVFGYYKYETPKKSNDDLEISFVFNHAASKTSWTGG